jgi:tetratricopeptide (TPR) repeat protein
MGFMDLQMHHINTRVERACLIGDADTFHAAYAKAEDLIRRQGNPLLLESRVALRVPTFYFERGELDLARAAMQRLSKCSSRLPMDKWLKLYTDVQEACVRVMAGEGVKALDAITAAAQASEQAEFKQLPLALIWRSRLLRSLNRRDEARAATEHALRYSQSDSHGTPFYEILGLRELAALDPEKAHGALERAADVCQRTENTVQTGAVALARAQLFARSDRGAAAKQVEIAQEYFGRARAPVCLAQVQRFIEQAANN